MFCLQNITRYFLAAAALGCLSTSVIAPQGALSLAEASDRDETSHRGSGRIVTQGPEAMTALEGIAYRGTGRLEQRNELKVGHRGSGRIDNQSPDTRAVAYRGSGRVSPRGLSRPEFV